MLPYGKHKLAVYEYIVFPRIKLTWRDGNQVRQGVGIRGTHRHIQSQTVAASPEAASVLVRQVGASMRHVAIIHASFRLKVCNVSQGQRAQRLLVAKAEFCRMHCLCLRRFKSNFLFLSLMISCQLHFQKRLHFLVAVTAVPSWEEAQIYPRWCQRSSKLWNRRQGTMLRTWPTHGQSPARLLK